MAHKDNSSDHNQRILELKQRQNQFDEQNKRLKNFLSTLLLKWNPIQKEEDLIKFNYELRGREEYTPVGYKNTPYSRLFRATKTVGAKTIKLYCRIIEFKESSTNPNHQNVALEKMKISSFISNIAEDAHRWTVKIYDLFCLGSTYYIFMEKFEISSSLMHLVWNRTDVPHQTIKQWMCDLSKAVESINICGVAHRFIRAENVLISSQNRIQLTSFDMACVFHDAEMDKPVLQQRMLLPLEVENFLLNHLPPECFTDDYDASQVDVWGIGCLACLLMTRNNPFQVGDKNYFQKWKYSRERRTLPEHFRIIFDDIFQEADQRITAFDLKNDRRLATSDDVPISKHKNTYYRIDLKKNINVNEELVKKASENTAVILSYTPEYSPNTEKIYSLHCFSLVPDEETVFKSYVIERNQSFSEEFKMLINENYLECRDDNSVKRLAKVFLTNQIPVRHKNIILNESGKIMKYLSQTPSSIRNNIHHLLDIFLSDTHMYLFYERILHCQPIYRLFTDNDQELRPSAIHIKQWMIQLADVIDHLYTHAISHRYIRPEYVLIENFNTLKLTHFDMACFVWNPLDKITTLRHRGLQDERENLWNHLPPECFILKYDSLLVDVWSFGTLLLFCLTQKNPFTVPHNEREAEEAWNHFLTMNYDLSHYKNILKEIFVPIDARKKISDLKAKLIAIDPSKSTPKKKSDNTSPSSCTKPKNKQHLVSSLSYDNENQRSRCSKKKNKVKPQSEIISASHSHRYQRVNGPQGVAALNNSLSNRNLKSQNSKVIDRKSSSKK